MRHRFVEAAGPIGSRYLLKRTVAISIALTLGWAVPAFSQSLDDLNVQLHGYVTQGFLYTTENNIFTTRSSNGSPAWTDAVLNLSAQPEEKLRVSIQARYFLLGNYGNSLTIDYAVGDFKINDRFGVRFGKVKTPWGLYNESQDIDPAYLWALLPESIYPIDSRSSYLSHYGGVVYGTIPSVKKLGKFEYRAWGGEGLYNGGDGDFGRRPRRVSTCRITLKAPSTGALCTGRHHFPGS